MALTSTIEGGKKLCDWFAAVGSRAGRAVILPIMKAAFQPVVDAERGSITSVSGALAGSLSVRSGAGDRKGRISVFSAPSATTKEAVKVWSGSSKRQHHGFAARAAEAGRKRYRIFYGRFVEMGHRRVRRNKERQLYVAGSPIPAHPFAGPAMAARGMEAAETAEYDILKHLFGD